MKIKSTVAVLTFGACLTASMPAHADCYSAYTNATAACSTAQINTDNAANNTYNAARQNALNLYNTTVSQDATTQAQVSQACLDTYYTFTGYPQIFHDSGSCGSALADALSNADNTYNRDVVSCGTDPLCIIRAAAARDYSKAFAGCVASKCRSDAGSVYNQCVANSTAAQNQSDRLANAVFINSDGVAYATYLKTIATSDNYTAPVCNYRAWITEYNCLLDADCGQNSGNCCADNCAKTQNNAYLAAYVAYMNSWGPAYAQYQYDNYMCGVTQQHDDQVSSAQQQYAIDIANATFDYNQSLAYNLYQYTLGVDQAQRDRDVTLCGCNNTDDASYNLCVATANATQTANDAKALAAYYQKAVTPPSGSLPIGDNWNTWNATVTTANNALQAAYANHWQTEQTCVQNTKNTYDAICNSASAAYNKALNKADQDYQNCLQGCNNNG